MTRSALFFDFMINSALGRSLCRICIRKKACHNILISKPVIFNVVYLLENTSQPFLVQVQLWVIKSISTVFCTGTILGNKKNGHCKNSKKKDAFTRHAATSGSFPIK